MFLRKKLFKYAKPLLMPLLISSSFFITSTSAAGTIYIPVHRTIKNQPITKLEVVSLVKAKHKGRVLLVKKRATYSSPDCHHVKLLENSGEFQMIKVGCRKKSARK